MQYEVRFGSAFAIDQFGFVRRGTVTSEPDRLVFSGKRSWPTLAKLGIVLLVILAPRVLFGVWPGAIEILVALTLTHYFCASRGTLAIQKASVADVRRKGRRIEFKGQDPGSSRTRKTVFRVDTEANASTLERELRGDLQVTEQGVADEAR